MTTCPYCGTTYPSYRPECEKCGGRIPPSAAASALDSLAPLPDIDNPPAQTEFHLPQPPPPPRQISGGYIVRQMLADGWSFAAVIFVFIGGTFASVGFSLTISVIAAFVGLPFLGTGILFAGGGILVLAWRYSAAQKSADLLRNGVSILGKVTAVEENTNLYINHRHPWTISYSFELQGREYLGQFTTLSPQNEYNRRSTPVYVLYNPANPAENALYTML